MNPLPKPRVTLMERLPNLIQTALVEMGPGASADLVIGRITHDMKAEGFLPCDPPPDGEAVEITADKVRRWMLLADIARQFAKHVLEVLDG